VYWLTLSGTNEVLKLTCFTLAFKERSIETLEYGTYTPPSVHMFDPARPSYVEFTCLE
jgi:hypothetical protein